jgi:hypothetical protein
MQRAAHDGFVSQTLNGNVYRQLFSQNRQLNAQAARRRDDIDRDSLRPAPTQLRARLFALDFSGPTS